MVDTLKRWGQQALHLLNPFKFLYDALRLWLDADGLRMSAAMSFYGMLSLAPLLLLLVGLLGWWVDRATVESNLIGHVTSLMGARAAEVVQGALASARAPDQGRLASIFGFGLLLSGATGVFVELQSSLQSLWLRGQTPPPERAAWWRIATLRLRGLAYVLTLGFLLLVSLVLSTAIQMATTWAGTLVQDVSLMPVVRVLNEAVSFGITVALFVGMMRFGSGPKPSMRYLVFGAVVGTFLFTLGKQGLAWYLSTAAVVSAYGAAGSLVVLLMWIYFSSAILLFAASCAQALSDAGTELRTPLRRPRPAAGTQATAGAGAGASDSMPKSTLTHVQ